MLYTDLTKRALEICFEAHRDQRDKGGQPYVFHPFHLADRMETEEEVCTALLHDVVEDTEWELVQLKAEGFPDSVIEALTLLTHDQRIPYLTYVENLKNHPIAARVKLADLQHNSTPGRLRPAADRHTAQKNRDRLKKYLRAQAVLTGGFADLDAMELILRRTLYPAADPGTVTRKPAENEKAETYDGSRSDGAAGEIGLRTVFAPDGRVRRYVAESASAREREFTEKAELAEYLLQQGIPVPDIMDALHIE